jgi:hypothetical protein
VAAVSPNMLQTSDAELPEMLAGMRLQQGTPPHRHYIEEVNVVIKCFELKIIFVINSCKKIVYSSFNFNVNLIRSFCRTLYIKENIWT